MKSEDISKRVLDPDRGRAVAEGLRALGVGVKDELIKAAEQGYITELACGMPKCFCPDELGGASYFEPLGSGPWEPTFEHFPIPKREGGRRSVDNSILAHRLCNRLDFSISSGRSHRRDLQTIEKAREEAIRRNAESEPRVRYERFNTEDVYVVAPEPTDGREMDKPEGDESQS